VNITETAGTGEKMGLQVKNRPHLMIWTHYILNKNLLASNFRAGERQLASVPMHRRQILEMVMTCHHVLLIV